MSPFPQTSKICLFFFYRLHIHIRAMLSKHRLAFATLSPLHTHNHAHTTAINKGRWWYWQMLFLGRNMMLQERWHPYSASATGYPTQPGTPLVHVQNWVINTSLCG